jgi:NAD(P)-dependent dehydrogenase (short-subunit alcohol dehydrogenase family)
MLKGAGGVIVSCASIAGLKGFPNLPACVASKSRVAGLTRTAALADGRAAYGSPPCARE